MIRLVSLLLVDQVNVASGDTCHQILRINFSIVTLIFIFNGVNEPYKFLVGSLFVGPEEGSD